MIEDYQRLVAEMVKKGTARGYALGARDMLESVDDVIDAALVDDDGVALLRMEDLEPQLRELRGQVEGLLEQTGGEG